MNHVILKKTLYDEDIAPDLWSVVSDLYSDMSSKVKWHGELSDKFSIRQGVRQGAILSPDLYKMYVKPLPDELKKNAIGAHIGTIYVGTLAVADDFLFLSNCPDELQIMLNLSSSFSGERRYKIHTIKTTLVSRISTRTSREKDFDRQWFIGEPEIGQKCETEHLGIIRSEKNENNLNLKKRISLARRTLYALIKTGVHGCNDIDPKTSFKIYQVYVLPRLLYGLEVLSLSRKQLDELEKFHLETLKNIQSLPVRTANSIVYLLLGALPFRAELEKRQLGLLYSTLNCDNSTLNELSERQIILKNDGSFYQRVLDTMERYGLPDTETLKTLSKDQWKLIVKKAIRQHWTEQLRSEAETKSTLERCAISALRVGVTHSVWGTVKANRLDVMRGIVKARMLTGTYPLQVHRLKFNMDGVTDATCPMCYLEDEDITHVLTRCPALCKVRNLHLAEIKKKVCSRITGSTCMVRSHERLQYIGTTYSRLSKVIS